MLERYFVDVILMSIVHHPGIYWIKGILEINISKITSSQTFHLQAGIVGNV